MLLKCSADMQKNMNVKADKREETDRLFSWCAHTVKTSRRNCVVLMNSASKFNIVLWGLRAKDYEKLPTLIPEYIKTAMLSAHFSPEVIEKYLTNMGEPIICKNSNRSDISRLNKAVELVLDYTYYVDDYDKEKIYQSYATKWVNDRTVYSEDGEYYYAVKRFAAFLKERYGVPVYYAKMYQLKITLDFPDFEISREVLVPRDCTFNTLHNVIQKSFNWQDYHMYEFTPEGSNREFVITTQQMIDEAIDFYGGAEEYICDSDCTLESVFEDYDRIFYTYDMGDNWEHKIKLIKTITVNDDPKIKCLKVTGKAPPEDCGGAYGYSDLLARLEQGDEEAAEWVEYMGWIDKTERDINFSLSFI